MSDRTGSLPFLSCFLVLPAASHCLSITMKIPLMNTLCFSLVSTNVMSFLPSKISKTCYVLLLLLLEAKNGAFLLFTQLKANHFFGDHLWRFYCQTFYYVLKLGRKIAAFNSNLCGAHLTFEFILCSMTFLWKNIMQLERNCALHIFPLYFCLLYKLFTQLLLKSLAFKWLQQARKTKSHFFFFWMFVIILSPLL